MSNTTKTQPLHIEIDQALYSEYRQAEEALLQNANEVNRLTLKATDLETTISDLDTDRENKAMVKNNILAKYAIDLASAPDLATARSNYDESVHKLDESKELLSAVITALRQAQSKTTQLQSQKTAAQNKIWRSIHKYILERIRSESGYLFQHLEACSQQMGGQFHGNPFVASPKQVALDLMRQMAKDIFTTTGQIDQ